MLWLFFFIFQTARWALLLFEMEGGWEKQDKGRRGSDLSCLLLRGTHMSNTQMITDPSFEYQWCCIYIQACMNVLKCHINRVIWKKLQFSVWFIIKSKEKHPWEKWVSTGWKAFYKNNRVVFLPLLSRSSSGSQSIVSVAVMIVVMVVVVTEGQRLAWIAAEHLYFLPVNDKKCANRGQIKRNTG